MGFLHMKATRIVAALLLLGPQLLPVSYLLPSRQVPTSRTASGPLSICSVPTAGTGPDHFLQKSLQK